MYTEAGIVVATADYVSAMRAAALVLAVAVVSVVASSLGTAATPSRTLLNYGDSLAVGTGSFLEPYLAGWEVRDDARVGRHTGVAVRRLRSYGAGLPHVVSVSLGANDAPLRSEWFRQQVLAALEIAGGGRPSSGRRFTESPTTASTMSSASSIGSSARCASSTGSRWPAPTPNGSDVTACIRRAPGTAHARQP